MTWKHLGRVCALFFAVALLGIMAKVRTTIGPQEGRWINASLLVGVVVFGAIGLWPVLREYFPSKKPRNPYT